MKKYTFRLQPVLDMREKTLEEKRLEMAKVIKLLNEYNEGLEELNAKIIQAKVNLDAIFENEDNLDISAITGYKNYLAKLDNDIINRNSAIENIKKVLLQKQLEVSEAHKEVRVMETLKEKQSKAFYEHIEKTLANELDDIATTRYKAG